MTSINRVLAEIRSQRPRSAWSRGVQEYAIELLDNVKEWKGGSFDLTKSNYKKLILNGASDWKEYSWGGSSLIYDKDIAKRTSTKTELKMTDNGRRRPNAKEEWLDVQARALYQASMLISSAITSAELADIKASAKKTRRY